MIIYNLLSFAMCRFTAVTQVFEEHSESVTTLCSAFEIFVCIKMTADQIFCLFSFCWLFFLYWRGLKGLKHSGFYRLRPMTQLPDCFHPPAASLNNQQPQISWTASSQRLKWVKILSKGYWLFCMDFYLSKEWNAIHWPNYSLIFAAAVRGQASAPANARVVSWKCHRCFSAKSDKSASAFVRAAITLRHVCTPAKTSGRGRLAGYVFVGRNLQLQRITQLKVWRNHKVRCTWASDVNLGGISVPGL